MALKAKKKTLADKINSLLTTTPATFHSDDEAEDTKAKVVDHYDESDNSDTNFQISEIRKKNVDPLDQVDKRYKGKKVSRKDIYSDDDEDFDLQNTSESEGEKMDSMEEQSDDDMDDNNSIENIQSNESDIEDDNSDIENDYSEVEDEGDDDDIKNNESEDNIEDSKDSNESDNTNEELSYDSEMNLKQDSEDEENKTDFEDENDNDVSFRKLGRDIQTMSQTNVRAEIEKGNCVRSQLKLWENLLEVRIKLQKCLTVSNQMPQHDIYKDFKTNEEYMKTSDEMKNKLKILLNSMLQLQNSLLKQYPETKNLSIYGKKRKAEETTNTKLTSTEDPMDEEIPSDTEDENQNECIISDEDTEDFNENIFKKKLKLDNYEKILNDNHKSYIEYRNSVIQKWNEKTRIASGKLTKGVNETTLKQIEFILSDKEKLRNRSRLKRSEYKIVGKTETSNDDGRRIQEYDSEIYDDDDFYHQLLRDLIEHKSSDITDPIQLSKQWIQLQNMRKKLKRKIDTRATKGRRIRYNVHNKLVNFMAPITINDTWTDHAKDELYSSLFGKIKPRNEEVGH